MAVDSFGSFTSFLSMFDIKIYSCVTHQKGITPCRCLSLTCCRHYSWDWRWLWLVCLLRIWPLVGCWCPSDRSALWISPHLCRQSSLCCSFSRCCSDSHLDCCGAGLPDCLTSVSCNRCHSSARSKHQALAGDPSTRSHWAPSGCPRCKCCSCHCTWTQHTDHWDWRLEILTWWPGD